VGFAFKVGVTWCEDYRQNLQKSDSKDRLAIEMQSDIGQGIDKGSEEPSVINVAAEERKSKIMRTGIITAVSIALHNFPEGLVASWRL